MQTEDLMAEVAGASANIDAIAGRAAQNPELIDMLIAGLSEKKAKIKYGCLKVLRALSESAPAALYPKFDEFVCLLVSENVILKWGSIIIIGNLAKVDAENRINRILDQFLKPIAGPVMITAANTIQAAANIAQAKPELAKKVVQAVLGVESAKYQTSECRNIAIGHALESLHLFFEHLEDTTPVVAFVERQIDNPRNAVKRKATAFLKWYYANSREPDFTV